jgi:hypothetical protein
MLRFSPVDPRLVGSSEALTPKIVRGHIDRER